VWRSLAARFVRDEEAAGSNPATPTMFSQIEARFQDTGAGLLDRLTVVDRGIQRQIAVVTDTVESFT
jgi:hypothetical protein